MTSRDDPLAQAIAAALERTGWEEPDDQTACVVSWERVGAFVANLFFVDGYEIRNGEQVPLYRLRPGGDEP